MADDIALNIQLTSQQKKWLVLAVLVLIPILLSGYFRAYPATLPITDTWAEQTVESFYKGQISNSIRQQFPNLPDQQVQADANTQYRTFADQNKDRLAQEAEQTSQNFKQQMKNDVGETYLLAIDPWTYYMAAQQIDEQGHPGTELKDGKPWDGRMFAPLGRAAEHNWHSNVMLIVWAILGLFSSSMTLMGGAFWVPLIIASLATVPAFFLARRKAGNLGGFVAACIVAVHGAFLSRTPAGFSDTDAYNVFFPLLVAWLFLEAFEAKEQWKQFSFAAAAGLALGLYSKFWVGYWYILNIIIAVIVGYLVFIVCRELYQQYKSRKKKSWKPVLEDLKKNILLFLVFWAVTGVLVTAFYSLETFLQAPTAALQFTQLKVAANPSLWPNVLTTVAELNEVSFAGVVGNMGGKFLFWLGLVGVGAALLPWKKSLNNKDLGFILVTLLLSAYLITNKALGMNTILYLVVLAIPLGIGILLLLNDKRGIDIKYALLLLVWFIITMYATTKGVRFTLVLVPPMAVAIGTLIGILHKHLGSLLSTELDIPKKIAIPILAIILCLVLVAPIRGAHNIALSEVPSMNDAWYSTLVNIRDNSQPDAIITSWWDFGHWFKSIAERPVTFDGASQNTPMAHWVGKLLLTTDEDEAAGIMRMLNCGSYTGFDALKEHIGDTIVTKKLMDTIILVDQTEARALLANAGVSEEGITEVLALTHCEPPEGFLITSQDMVGKAGVWGHFGSWNFERARIYNELQYLTQDEAVQEMVNQFGYSEAFARDEYFTVKGLVDDRAANSWISPWPGYFSGWVSCRRETAPVNASALDINDTNSFTAGLTERELAVCPTSLRIGQQNGQDIVIEGLFIDLDQPEASRYRLGVYVGNQRVAQTDEQTPAVLQFAHENATDGLETFTFENGAVGVVFDEKNNRVIFADPLHAGSVFTQLFYLDGKYNDRFEILSDQTSFQGQRISVWSVVW